VAARSARIYLDGNDMLMTPRRLLDVGKMRFVTFLEAAPTIGMPRERESGVAESS
jgi:hypothetical protein